jgi:hypothetical protein
MKVCKNCGIEKELEFFYKQKSNKDGHMGKCKSCHDEKTKKYAQENKEKLKEYYKEYSNINRKKLTEKNKTYYEVNKDRLNELGKEYREVNKEKLMNQKKEYYEENRKVILEKKKLYQEANKEKLKEYRDINRDKLNEYNRNYSKNNRDQINLKRRIKMKNEPLEKLKSNIRCAISTSFRVMKYKKPDFTEKILSCSFLELKEYLESKFEDWMNWENRGLYNGEFDYGWDIDHIIPLSSGETEEEILKLNHYTNLQPLCSKINRDIKKDKLDYTKIDT